MNRLRIDSKALGDMARKLAKEAGRKMLSRDSWGVEFTAAGTVRLVVDVADGRGAWETLSCIL